jgi:hypothetical protein
MLIASETIFFAGFVFVLVAAAVAAYGVSWRVLHDYYRKLADYKPFGDAIHG